MIAPSQHDETEVNHSQKKLIIINSQITRISSSINQHNAILSISMELISLLQAVVKGKGAKVKQCTHHEGCTNQVVKGGVCIMHGAKQKRSSHHEGCTKQARSGSHNRICVTHGAKRKRYTSVGCLRSGVPI